MKNGSVGGELEGLLQVRLDPEQREPALHRALGHPLRCRHQAHAPLRGLIGPLLQCSADDCCQLLVVVGARASGPQLIVQTLHAAFQEPPPPLAHRLRRGSDLGGDRRVAEPFGTGENHARPHHQAMRHRRRSGHRFQLLLLLAAERQLSEFRSPSHRPLHSETSINHTLN